MSVFICEKFIILSIMAVFIAVAADFIKFNDKNITKKSKRSIVATGSMFGFFFVYYVVLRLGWGAFDVNNMALIATGTAMIVLGAAVNILGRLQLGGNWSNHIKIYEDHKLVIRGIYKVIRHPLYASIMLMLFGGSLAYRNWLSAVLTALVFIPFMYYRAKQEETLLCEEFEEYEEYRGRTGMFFPRLWR